MAHKQSYSSRKKRRPTPRGVGPWEGSRGETRLRRDRAAHLESEGDLLGRRQILGRDLGERSRALIPDRLQFGLEAGEFLGRGTAVVLEILYLLDQRVDRGSLLVLIGLDGVERLLEVVESRAHLLDLLKNGCDKSRDGLCREAGEEAHDAGSLSRQL